MADCESIFHTMDVLTTFISNVEDPSRDQTGVWVSKISLNSPLAIEVASVSAAVISTLVLLLKNPERLGAYVQKVRKGYYVSKLEADKAKAALNELQSRKVEARELET